MGGATYPTFALSHVPFENEITNKTLKAWSDSIEGLPAPIVLPPGITTDVWATILKQFQDILGDGNVVVGDQHQLNYTDPFTFVEDESEKRGSPAALLPTTVEHIQAILKVANEHKLPLWTFSRGKNLGYGGPAGRVKVRCCNEV
jgi:4-cresol dehydrogenase (hydroxylating)